MLGFVFAAVRKCKLRPYPIRLQPKIKMISRLPAAKNVFGEPLVPCSFNPLTGYFRDGCCKTNQDDVGTHVICTVMTPAFLAYSKACGNDLSTPRPEWHFAGLRPGDQWCLCANRWMQAWHAGVAPKVVLESTNQTALQIVSLEELRKYAYAIEEEE